MVSKRINKGSAGKTIKVDESLLSSLDNELLIEGEVTESLVVFFEECLQEVFSSRENFYLSEFKKKISKHSANQQSFDLNKSESSDSWIGIESLSRLRAVVGGRFQNIKQKWMDAGFPLKEHRGEVALSYDISQDGWIKLSTWISNQGFEVRLTPDKQNQIFEIKAIKGK
jgi:hypothetical protein